jgi:hypothetical protein
MMAVAIAILFFRTREPVADGRTLSEWLEESQHVFNADPAAATNAIRKIGPAALPFLLNKLQAKDPAWKTALQESDYRDKFPFRWLHSASRQNQQAQAGFAILGAEAAPAIPELWKLMSDPDRAGLAGVALGYIGAPARSVLKAALTNQTPPVRIAALMGLSVHRIEIEEFWPDVLRLSRDAHSTVAFEALRNVIDHLEHPDAIEAVRHALANTNAPATQVGTLLLLTIRAEVSTNFNPTNFISDVLPLLGSKDRKFSVKQYATDFLLTHDPVTAAAHGIKTNAWFQNP